MQIHRDLLRLTPSYCVCLRVYVPKMCPSVLEHGCGEGALAGIGAPSSLAPRVARYCRCSHVRTSPCRLGGGEAVVGSTFSAASGGTAAREGALVA